MDQTLIAQINKRIEYIKEKLQEALEQAPDSIELEPWPGVLLLARRMEDGFFIVTGTTVPIRDFVFAEEDFKEASLSLSLSVFSYIVKTPIFEKAYG